MTTALVVLNPSGGILRGDDIITAENHRQYLPSAEELEAAMAWFTDAGFTVEAPGPNSFAIEGSDGRFREVFGHAEGPFDVTALPEPIARSVAAVEVPGAPDFGPGNP